MDAIQSALTSLLLSPPSDSVTVVNFTGHNVFFPRTTSPNEKRTPLRVFIIFL